MRISFQSNHTLLSRRLGDALRGLRLTVQPHVRTQDPTQGLPVLPRLRRFLDDPLGGTRFDLALPFDDPDVKLTQNGAWLRGTSGGSALRDGRFHCGIDFALLDNGHNASFPVHAPADGVVVGLLGPTGTQGILLEHFAGPRCSAPCTCTWTAPPSH